MYAIVNEKGEIAAIVYMSKDMKRTKQIDLTHFHGEMKPHTHHGYLHNELDSKKGASNLTTEEKRMVEFLLKTWKNRNANRS